MKSLRSDYHGNQEHSPTGQRSSQDKILQTGAFKSLPCWGEGSEGSGQGVGVAVGDDVLPCGSPNSKGLGFCRKMEGWI
jgi:hypothetical protein